MSRSKTARRHLEADEHADFRDRSIFRSDGVEVDLTGYTAELEIKREYFDNRPILELTTENGHITLGQGSPGEILLTLPAEKIDTLKPLYRANEGYTDFEQDFLLIAPDGFRRKLWAGRFRVWDSVTRKGPLYG